MGVFLKHAIVSLLYSHTTLLLALGNFKALGLLEGMLMPKIGGLALVCRYRRFH